MMTLLGLDYYFDALILMISADGFVVLNVL